MRIFPALYHSMRKRTIMPNGNIYRGKYRIVKEPKFMDIQTVKDGLEVEEKNMFFLRHPYLTPEQSAGHAVALGKPETNYLNLLAKKKEFFEDVTIESRLGHLRYNESWD